MILFFKPIKYKRRKIQIALLKEQNDYPWPQISEVTTTWLIDFFPLGWCRNGGKGVSRCVGRILETALCCAWTENQHIQWNQHRWIFRVSMLQKKKWTIRFIWNSLIWELGTLVLTCAVFLRSAFWKQMFFNVSAFLSIKIWTGTYWIITPLINIYAASRFPQLSASFSNGS